MATYWYGGIIAETKDPYKDAKKKWNESQQKESKEMSDDMELYLKQWEEAKKKRKQEILREQASKIVTEKHNIPTAKMENILDAYNECKEVEIWD